jgi:hypothetical protein
VYEKNAGAALELSRSCLRCASRTESGSSPGGEVERLLERDADGRTPLTALIEVVVLALSGRL